MAKRIRNVLMTMLPIIIIKLKLIIVKVLSFDDKMIFKELIPNTTTDISSATITNVKNTAAGHSVMTL